MGGWCGICWNRSCLTLGASFCDSRSMYDSISGFRLKLLLSVFRFWAGEWQVFYLGIRASGAVAGCSFMGDSGLTVWDLKNKDTRLETFQPYFDYIKSAPEPCKSCDYLTICKGGCRAVSAHVTGDPMAPDPDCPEEEEGRRRRVPVRDRVAVPRGRRRRGKRLVPRPDLGYRAWRQPGRNGRRRRGSG